MFKIASFNTNSVRARMKIILDWLEKERPDALCLQETKVEDSKFPAEDFSAAGYNCIFKGQKSYNGVAILSPHRIEEFNYEPLDFEAAGEARLLAARIKGVNIVNSYVPQGRAVDSDLFIYKLNWLKGIKEFFQNNYDPGAYVVWAGDFNVALEPIDVYAPERLYGRVCYHPEEHKVMQKVKEWGFVDVFRQHVQEEGHYTFWDYRVPNGVKRKMGWRIDHIWAAEPLALLSSRAWIDMEPRLKEKPSDHTFISAEFNI